MNKHFSYQPTETKPIPEAPKVDNKTLEDRIKELSDKIDSLYSLVEKLKGIYK